MTFREMLIGMGYRRNQFAAFTQNLEGTRLGFAAD